MSLFDRVVVEARSSTTFTPQKGSDSYSHTDRWKAGRRNRTPTGNFVFKDVKRYPVNAFSRASAAGSLRQAYKRGQSGKVAGAVKSNKGLNMCPTKAAGCPPPRNHGPGGKPEHKTQCKGPHCKVKDTPPDHGGKFPWKFNVGKKPTWQDSDWSKKGKKKGRN